MQRRRLPARTFILSLVAVLLLLGLAGTFGFDRPLRSAASALLKPFQSATVRLVETTRGWFGRSGQLDELIRQLEAVRTERNDLLVELATLRTRLDETEQAAGQAAVLSERSFRFQVARVIGRSLDPTDRSVTIDQGSLRGITAGQAVVIEEGIIIGRVTGTTGTTANVMLLTDRRSRIASTVQNDRNSPGLVRGELGLALRLELVPKDEPLADEQRVVTSGLEPSIPRGLLIGSIEAIEAKPTDLFQSARLVSPATFDRLQIVSVIFQ